MDNKKILDYTIIIIVVLGVLAFAWEFINRDTRFCRSVLNGLVKGSVKVEKFIDWEKLKATGLDIGATYRRIATPSDKSIYRRLFIRNFATGFHSTKGDFRKFVNWRILERKATKVVVAADYLLYNKTILFTLSKIPKTKIIAIEWKE
jgi:hypothetical protein